jgi:glycolate oxidase FAD binding subunit
LRDYVIGISVVDGDAKETKAGGRVVKNVAGYDLCKLYIGSLGTLGIVTQVTLKLRPLPEASDMLWIQFLEQAHIAAALDRLAASRARATAIDVLNSAAAEHVAVPFDSTLVTRPWVAVIGFEENADAVKWQIEQVAAELHGVAAWSRRFEGEQADRLWSRLVEFQVADLGPLTFKANFRSSSAVYFLDHARRQPDDWAIQVHAGNGIAYGHSVRSVEPSDVQPSLAKLRELAVALRGNLIVRRCPTEWKANLPVWGRPPSDLWLMQDLKRTLDPHGILNPGRFLA